MWPLSVLSFSLASLVVIDFLTFVITGKRILKQPFLWMVELTSMIILPILFLFTYGNENSCCGQSAFFSPEHNLTIWIIISLSLIAYSYSSYRKRIATPVIEILVNVFLLIGIILNVFIAIHTDVTLLALGGNLPIILLAILAMTKNHQLFVEYFHETHFNPKNNWEKLAWHILNYKPLIKFPLLLVLILPVMMILIALLLLTGQKPDSTIRAFTDTYYQGLSQWTYQCDNIECGGHYLCSVAAGGHQKIVKPKRWGIRNGGIIICNRQLLVSNAFEEMIQEKFPLLHKRIRNNYDRVGNLVHRYYYIFNNKYVADITYIVMKPLEWIFLIVLYSLDRNPENRIERQYVSRKDNERIKEANKMPPHYY